MDATETARRQLRQEIQQEVASPNPDQERQRLEAKHGQVWNTSELQQDFEVLGFAAPLIVARRRSDGCLGSLFFQHEPRFYWGFDPHE